MKLSCSLLQNCSSGEKTASWVRRTSVVTQHGNPKERLFGNQVSASLAIGDVGMLWMTHLKPAFPKPQNPDFRRGLCYFLLNMQHLLGPSPLTDGWLCLGNAQPGQQN